MAEGHPSPLREAFAACRATFFGAAAFSLATNLLMLTTSIYMLQVYDRVLGSGSLPTLFYLTLVAGGAVLLLALLEIARSHALVRASVWLEQKLAAPTLERVVDGRLAGRPGRAEALHDLGTVRGFLGGAGVLNLFDAPWVPIYVAAVYLLHVTLGHIALAGAVLLLVLAVTNDLATRRRLRQATAASRRAAGCAEAALRNAEVIDALGLTDRMAQRWARDGQAALDLHRQAAGRSAWVSGTSRFVRLFLQIAVLGAGAHLVIAQEITAGMMIAASIITARALAPVEQAIAGWKQAVQAFEAKRRLNELFRLPPRRPNAIPLPRPSGRLSVEGVVYGFAADRPAVLKGVSFRLQPGDSLGIIGPSAAGKSTLARLLVGIDRPGVGAVRLDGADIFTWPRPDLGRYLGYLPQDVELFSGTVAENIARLGDPDPEAVVRAATRAGCHEMILRLEQGYATELGEAGVRLSGGQRQRVALARALYGEPALVVLDEPNASLDAEGEASLNQAIAELKAGGATVIVIGHRPGTFAAVDKLLVLVDGAVQDFGPRPDVLAKLTRRVLHPLRVPRPAPAAGPDRPAAAGESAARP